jgi:hypothetical protein
VVLQKPKHRATVFLLLVLWLCISRGRKLGSGVHICTILDSSHTQGVQTVPLIQMVLSRKRSGLQFVTETFIWVDQTQ